jgi:hypothetical protein
MEDEIKDEQHSICVKDPDEWMQYVYKQVNVLVEDGSEYTGWIKDAVSSGLNMASNFAL